MRVRRHFIEPARVTTAESTGRDVRPLRHRRRYHDAVPHPRVPAAAPSTAARALSIDLHATSANPRPLGMAMDWIEIDPATGARVRLPASTRLALAGGRARDVRGAPPRGRPPAVARGRRARRGPCRRGAAGSRGRRRHERILREGWARTSPRHAWQRRSCAWPRARVAHSARPARWSGGAGRCSSLAALAVRLVAAPSPRVLLPRRARPRALRLAARAPRPRRVPARVHRQPVPLQPRAAVRKRTLVRVPLSARVLPA